MNRQVLEHIKRSGSGLYAWLTPDPQSILALQALTLTQSNPAIKWVHTTEYHCTVVHHSPEVPPDLQLPNITRTFPARATGLTLFGDHVAMLLSSPRLHSLFRYFEQQGIQHDYDPYNPHITLGKRVADTDLTGYLANVNLMLKKPLYVSLNRELSISLLD